MIVASVLAEAKVGCLSLSRHPPPAPPGETLDILVIFVSLCLLLLLLLLLFLLLLLLRELSLVNYPPPFQCHLPPFNLSKRPQAS